MHNLASMAASFNSIMVKRHRFNACKLEIISLSTPLVKIIQMVACYDISPLLVES